MKLKKCGGKKIHREQITLRINISQRMQGGKRLQKWKASATVDFISGSFFHAHGLLLGIRAALSLCHLIRRNLILS